jgi:hypothetical protein
MKLQHLAFYTFLALAFSVVACKKTEENPAVDPNSKGNLTVEFDNVAGNEDLSLNKEYTNAKGETFRITKLCYYVSNLKLKKADGSEYVYNPDSSYFLVKEDEITSQQVLLQNVPQGDYTGLTFTIGVDSLRCTADLSKRTGVLDIAGDMYWSWNSGYIFFKMEGTSPQAPADPNGNRNFYLHIGGFGGYSTKTLNNLRTVTVSTNSDKAMVRSNISPEIHLLTDVMKVMNGGSTQVSMATNSFTMAVSDFSAKVADNYAAAFTLDHVHNDKK